MRVKKVNKRTYGTCTMANCEENATHKGARLCHACYQYVRTWQIKGVTATMQRQRKVKLFEERLSSVAPSGRPVARSHSRQRAH